MANKIEHVIVLMLENRSFDHMLGYLDHDNPDYPRLTGNESNPHLPGNPDVTVSPDAEETILVGPNHHHEAMVRHMYGVYLEGNKFNYDRPTNNKGFAWEYEEYVKEVTKNCPEGKTVGYGKEIMKCFRPDKIPVLSTLAKEFAVCTRWFSSVPGQTWPNRCYLHAGTSEGEVDIHLKPYCAKTIFELFNENNNVPWKVYHDGVTHLMVYGALSEDNNRFNFKSVKRLYDDIKDNKLPAYSFVEPDHFGIDSTSQHPNNNTNAKGKRDFLRAEKLIADIYNALITRPDVFNKTLFVITYDENGGMYDREPPPYGNLVIPPDDDIHKKTGFTFNVLGPRVPAVLVSPLIPQGTIDKTRYDHTSVIRSLCELFVSGKSLLKRDRAANSFLHNLSLSSPRMGFVPLSPRTDYDQDAVDHVCEGLDDNQNALINLMFEVNASIDDGTSNRKGTKRWLGLESDMKRIHFKNNNELYKFTKMVTGKFRKHPD